MTEPNQFAVPLDKAKAMLAVYDGTVHTFRSAIGADWPVDRVLEVMERYGVSEAGPMAQAMGHALIVVDDRGPLFLATKKEPADG